MTFDFNPRGYLHITVTAEVGLIGDLPCVYIQEISDWNGNEVSERLIEDWECEALEIAGRMECSTNN